MTSKDNPDLELEVVYPIIGEVCALWAEIEFFIRELILLLAQYHNSLYVGEATIPLDIALRNTDIRQKAEIAKALAHQVSEDKEFFPHTRELMDEITNTLREARNRLVHDDWVMADDGALHQRRYEGRVRREQAREWAISLRREVRHEDSGELSAALTRFQVAQENLLFLRLRLEDILVHRAKLAE